MPRDLLVLGCGRSGTSLAAGLFRAAGYFQGEELHPARDSNPLGFFEDVEVNDINEALLAPILPARQLRQGVEYLADAPTSGQRWLARIPLDQQIAAAPDQLKRIGRLVAR